MESSMHHRGRGDVAAVVHAGRFAEDNGGCGYILKPPHLRQGDGEAGLAPIRLELRVIAARAVPSASGRKLLEGYAILIVSVHGSPMDSAREAYRPCKATGPIIVW